MMMIISRPTRQSELGRGVQRPAKLGMLRHRSPGLRKSYADDPQVKPHRAKRQVQSAKPGEKPKNHSRRSRRVQPQKAETARKMDIPGTTAPSIRLSPANRRHASPSHPPGSENHMPTTLARNRTKPRNNSEVQSAAKSRENHSRRSRRVQSAREPEKYHTSTASLYGRTPTSPIDSFLLSAHGSRNSMMNQNSSWKSMEPCRWVFPALLEYF